MKTNGTIVTIEFDGEPIGSLKEFEYDSKNLPKTISWSATVYAVIDLDYYTEANDYFMKALMYALTFKN